MGDTQLPPPCVVGTPLSKRIVAGFSKMTGFGRSGGIARWILYKIVHCCWSQQLHSRFLTCCFLPCRWCWAALVQAWLGFLRAKRSAACTERQDETAWHPQTGDISVPSLYMERGRAWRGQLGIRRAWSERAILCCSRIHVTVEAKFPRLYFPFKREEDGRSLSWARIVKF